MKRNHVDERLLIDGEAADILMVPRRRLVRLAKSGQIPAIFLPDGEIRFLETDLWAWVEQHRRADLATPDARK